MDDDDDKLPVPPPLDNQRAAILDTFNTWAGYAHDQSHPTDLNPFDVSGSPPHDDRLQMNSFDYFDLPSLGRTSQNIDSLNQDSNVAMTTHNTFSGNTMQIDSISIVAGHQSASRNNRTNRTLVSTANVEDHANNPPPTFQASAAALKYEESDSSKSSKSSSQPSPGRDSWFHKFGLLREYKSEHGNLDVPQKLVPLGIWVNKV